MHEPIETNTALAAALGVNRGTVYTWLKSGILPDGPPWDLNECRAAVDEHETEKDARATDATLRQALDTAQAARIRGRIEDTRRKRERGERRLATARRNTPRRDLLSLILEPLPALAESRARFALDCHRPPTLEPGETCRAWVEKVEGAQGQFRKLQEWPVRVRDIVQRFTLEAGQ